MHIVDERDNEATFASYIHVTQVAERVAGQHSRRYRDRRRARQEPDGLRISELHVVLDTMTSDVFSNVKRLNGNER